MASGLTFSINGQRRVEKMSNLKARKFQSLTKRPPNFCPSCDEQVITSAFGKLRINFHLYFQRFPNFVKTLKIRVKLFLNFPRALSITYTNWLDTYLCYTSDDSIRDVLDMLSTLDAIVVTDRFHFWFLVCVVGNVSRMVNNDQMQVIFFSMQLLYGNHAHNRLLT